MEPSLVAEFKTLLSEEEYKRLVPKYKGNPVDLQTNHYLDTERFSLKATEASLRVRERDILTLTYKRKKGYNIQDLRLNITSSEFEAIKETGVLPESDIANEVASIIGDQKLFNFMSLSTERLFFKYGNGMIFIDKSSYLGVVDYELEYEAKNYYDGKKEFLQLLSDLKIKYKKSDKKIKRAYTALKDRL